MPTQSTPAYKEHNLRQLEVPPTSLEWVHTFLNVHIQSWLTTQPASHQKSLKIGTEKRITHLTGASYRPATSGAAERLGKTFKQALKMSSKSPEAAQQEFLMHYQRTPLPAGFLPSQLLNGRQIRCKIVALLLSGSHYSETPGSGNNSTE